MYMADMVMPVYSFMDSLMSIPNPLNRIVRQQIHHSGIQKALPGYTKSLPEYPAGSSMQRKMTGL
jgi:hypothetical protein